MSRLDPRQLIGKRLVLYVRHSRYSTGALESYSIAWRIKAYSAATQTMILETCNSHQRESASWPELREYIDEGRIDVC